MSQIPKVKTHILETSKRLRYSFKKESDLYEKYILLLKKWQSLDIDVSLSVADTN